MQTRAGSAIRAHIPPAVADAEIVLALRAQGAIILGKVHTTEFAFQDPSPTRNPFNIDHTPGGSSSGSAAVVASGMLPAAVGTQTGASVNRPAAYCGIAAFKPSSGSFSTWGIIPLAPSYDTPGFFGWNVDDAAYLFEAVAPPFVVNRPAPASRVYILEDPHWADATSEMLSAVQNVAAACESAGCTVARRRSPIDFAWLFELQRTTMLYEASRALRAFLNEGNAQIGEKLRSALDEGAGISRSRYLDERAKIEEMRRELVLSVEPNAVFLWPAAPSTAPKGLNWTGDTKYISPWTAFGGPIATIPSGVAADGLPSACILMACPGYDRMLCDVARRIAMHLASA
jgi:aspartyl-tRNA(Asn)/glutamyl-tRNA(Gln) amidotransferase subunit A